MRLGEEECTFAMQLEDVKRAPGGLTTIDEEAGDGSIPAGGSGPSRGLLSQLSGMSSRLPSDREPDSFPPDFKKVIGSAKSSMS